MGNVVSSLSLCENMTISKQLIQCYIVRISSEWATINLRQFKGGGAIDIQSSYGNFANTWNATGDHDFRQWVSSLDYSYFFNKTSHTRGYKFSPEDTLLLLKKDILEYRREGNSNSEKVRLIWDELRDFENFENWENVDSNLFYVLMRDYKSLFDFVRHDEFPTREIKDIQCVGFWETIWPEIKTYWEEEIKQEKELDKLEKEKSQQDF